MASDAGQVSGTETATEEISWARVRELFSLDPSIAHLNNGAHGAVPIPVKRAQQRLRDEMDANPMAFFTRDLLERIAEARRACAQFVGSDPDGTALVANATTASQVVLGSVDVGPGDEILLTDHGYGAIRLAVQRLCARTGATLREISLRLCTPRDGSASGYHAEVLTSVTAAVRPGRTRLAIVDHITSPTATVFPISRIVQALREREVPVLVDATHAPGMLAVDVGALGADYWIGNLHKWAFSPRSVAVLAVAPQHRASIRPLVVSWEQHSGFPAAVEFGGTLDYTAWLAAPVGLAVLRTLGQDRVRQHNAQLVAYGQSVVAAALDLDPADVPLPGDDLVSMRLIPLPPGVADDLALAAALRWRIASELACEVAAGPWRGRGYLRLSAQIYNRPEEYERLAQALPRVLAAVQADLPAAA